MKLNLGCGRKIFEGYVNVDKFDFDNVNEEELLSMGVDKNTLAEC